MIKVVECEWVRIPPISSPRREESIKELMSYHALCSTCCVLETDECTGQVYEQTPNSALHWSRVVEWPWVLEKAELKGTEYVLDAAGGHAVLQYALAKRAKKVFNFDLDTFSLRAVDEMALKLKLYNLVTYKRNILDTGYHDCAFDRVVCVSVLEHIPEWRSAFNELVRVLRVGGSLLLTFDVVINGAYTDDYRIDAVGAVEFVEAIGGHVPNEMNGVLKNRMPCGTILSCLCLKIVKE